MNAFTYQYTAAVKRLKKTTWLQIAIPLLLTIVATYITLNPIFEVSYRTPFLLYFGVIFISAAFGGSRSSIVATLSAAVLSLGFILPRYQPNSKVFGIATIIFCAEGLLLSRLFVRIEKTQKRLHESEQRFRGIIEKSAEGMLMTDRYGKIEYMSPSVSVLLGADSKAFIGEPFISLIHPEENTFAEQLLLLEKYKISEFDFLTRLRAHHDRYIWIEGTAMNLTDEQSIGSFVFQYRDVSSRIELEMQKEEFLHLASHELKTPITSIKGFLQILKKHHQKEVRIKDIAILERIEQQADKLVKLINDLLDMSKIRNGELSYRFEGFNLKDQLLEIIDNCKTTYPTHQFSLTCSEQVLVYADRDRISQVIISLLNNAIKYSPGKTRIEISITNEGEYLKTAIRDEGIGIPHDQQQKIFDRFHRYLEPAKKTINGLGIGLYLSNEIIKRHKGFMGVTSEIGQGSEFWFNLPMLNESAKNQERSIQEKSHALEQMN